MVFEIFILLWLFFFSVWSESFEKLKIKVAIIPSDCIVSMVWRTKFEKRSAVVLVLF